MNQNQIDETFERLQKALKDYPVSAEEFMLMDINYSGSHTTVAFKHINTRDYAYLHMTEDGNYVRIPQTDKPFQTGSFLNQ